MIEPKKTQKQLAEDLGINEKTMRSYLRINGYFSQIDKTLNDPEKSEAFAEIFNQKSNNKKECISTIQLQALSMMSKQDLEPIIDRILKHPDNAKQIIRNRIPTPEKVTISIDGWVNDWFAYKSEECGMSKGELLQRILLDYYDSHQEDW